MYGGCGTDESTVSHRTLIHLNYMEAVSVCMCVCLSLFVHSWVQERVKDKKSISMHLWVNVYVHCIHLNACVPVKMRYSYVQEPLHQWFPSQNKIQSNTENKTLICLHYPEIRGNIFFICVSNFLNGFISIIIKENFLYPQEIFLRVIHRKQPKLVYSSCYFLPLLRKGVDLNTCRTEKRKKEICCTVT